MSTEAEVREMPKAPNFTSLIGPSFILLGMGLGSGEIILWPYLISNFGLGLIWGAVLGITFQFFINMEIERYSLVRGESVFVGYAKKLKILPFWFIISTLVSFGWPGIVGASAKLLGQAAGFEYSNYVAIGLLVLIGVILTLGPVLYKTVEKVSIILILIGVPSIFFLTLYLSKSADWLMLLKGIVGQGEGYLFLHDAVPIASFLGAFAFSGAAGNLNLAQSFYIKEKGYGMGRFSGKITSIITGKKEDIKLEGARFEINSENIERFKKWWRLVNLEHLIVFWLTGAISICLLGLLAYVTAYGKTDLQAGINFVIFEAQTIATNTTPFIGTFFLIIGGLMLFNTQLAVFDATSRIMSENLLIIEKGVWHTRILPYIYYAFLWLQIIFGVGVFLTKMNEPLLLLTISSVAAAVTMFVHIGLTTWLNMTTLEKELRPSRARLTVIGIAFAFFGYFSIRTLFTAL